MKALPLLSLIVGFALLIHLFTSNLPRSWFGALICVVPTAILMSVPMLITALVTRERVIVDATGAEVQRDAW